MQNWCKFSKGSTSKRLKNLIKLQILLWVHQIKQNLTLRILKKTRIQKQELLKRIKMLEIMKQKWLKNNVNSLLKWRSSTSRCRSRDLTWLKLGMLPLKILFFCLSVNKFATQYQCLDTGPRREDIYSIKEAYTRYLSNCLTLSSKQVLASSEKRLVQLTMLKLSSKRWENECSQRWAK